jgi:hypothetical protein
MISGEMERERNRYAAVLDGFCAQEFAVFPEVTLKDGLAR